MIIPNEIMESVITLKDQLLDLRGLSVYSSLAVPTLRDYIRSGNLPCFKVKGKVLVRKSEFDTWLEEYRVNKSRDIKRIADEVLGSLKSRESDKLSEGHKL